ncbi:camphor resistance protein CrcB [Clostridia bacterium]|nr:camphor resistance protein CrcB [Clostridia bacterium]GHV31644.1 camphor resistance protein CrcB [Clostridia bacterium]
MGFIFVGIGGFLGSCGRYGLSRLFAAYSFPLGTLLSNIIAGFLIGACAGMGTNLPPRAKLFLMTGLLGGLSTFSAFTLETLDFMRAGKYLWAIGNAALNLTLCLAFCALGMWLVKKL